MQCRYKKFYGYVYQTPYFHIGAFAIGLLTGHEIYRLRNRLNVPKHVQLIGYAVACFVCITVIYCSYGADWSLAVYAWYFATSRVAWSSGVCLLIWLSAMRPNSTLDAFLSAPVFVVFSNLSYCAYLIHPIVQLVYFYSFKSSIAGSHAILFVNFISIAFITYIFSSMLFVTIEMPLLAFKSIRLHPNDKSDQTPVHS